MPHADREDPADLFHLLMENVREYAVFVMDPDGVVTEWNAGAERVLGYTEDEAVGSPCVVVFTPEDRDAGVPERELEGAARSGQAMDERWHVRKGGERFWASGVMTALRDGDGEVRGFVKILRDNTERKGAEEALRESEGRLRELNRTLESRVEERAGQVRRLARALTLAEQGERRRIADLLHDDLQQRLYALAVTLRLLRRPQPEEEADRLLERAEGALGEATALTRSLSHELSPALLQGDDLAVLLEWVADRKRERYGLDIEVEVRGEVSVPEEGVRVLLHQLLRELLFNVAKHAGTPGARIIAEGDAEGVRVTVEDEGGGFDPSALKGRDGLGLASVRERLVLVGGRLDVESAPGEGTRVTVTVPRGDQGD